MTDYETLVSDFEAMPVRRIVWDTWPWGAGRIGSTIPKPQAWQEGQPQRLGTDIEELLTDDAWLRVHASPKHPQVIHRRELKRQGWMSGKPYSMPVYGQPILAAQITEVIPVDIGRDRTLPVLKLVEFGDRSPDQEFGVSLSDLAEYIQRQQVALTLT